MAISEAVSIVSDMNTTGGVLRTLGPLGMCQSTVCSNTLPERQLRRLTATPWSLLPCYDRAPIEPELAPIGSTGRLLRFPISTRLPVTS